MGTTRSEAGSRPRASLALTFQMLSRGMPALTWGTEAWLPGGEEPDNRRDMPWSSLSDPDVARNLSDIRGLADLRTDWPVLQDGRTVILQQDADAIVVMDAGGVAEVGTHDELLAADGLYARLTAHQLAAAAGASTLSGSAS